MKRPLHPSSLRASFFAVTFLWLIGASLRAQTARPEPAERATGSVAGRILNPATGTYVEGARLTIEGTSLETFSDLDGNYRLTGVPNGSLQKSNVPRGRLCGVDFNEIPRNAAWGFGFTRPRYYSASTGRGAPIRSKAS